MRKVTLLFMMAIASFSLKAQTLDETLTWLNEKLTNNLQGYYASKGVMFYRQTPTSFTIDECQLVVKITEESSYSGGGSWYYTMTVPLQDMIIRNDGRFANFGIKKLMTGTTYRDKGGVNGETMLTDTDGWFRINQEKEKDILERMRKAFEHLATFCPAKKAETF